MLGIISLKTIYNDVIDTKYNYFYATIMKLKMYFEDTCNMWKFFFKIYISTCDNCDCQDLDKNVCKHVVLVTTYIYEY